MTEAETAVREALAKMAPPWNVHTMTAGIVALRNHTPALLAELDAARVEVDALAAEVVRLRRGLGLCATERDMDGKPTSAAIVAQDYLAPQVAALEPRP